MSDHTLRRSHRFLAILLDWIVVLGILVGIFSVVGVPGGGSVILLILLLAVVVLVPLLYFKLLKLVIGTTVGPVVVRLFRRGYRKIRS